MSELIHRIDRRVKNKILKAGRVAAGAPAEQAEFSFKCNPAHMPDDASKVPSM